VTLDSDAFPLQDGWLQRLREQLTGNVKVTGILHHRDYIHPSCLMIERCDLEELNLNFLDEKSGPSQFDVAERISHEVKRCGFQISGLAQTSALRRGSVSEPVWLGAEYAGLIHHQWYTTRTVISGGCRVDDVPPSAIEQSFKEVFGKYHAESRELAVIVGVRTSEHEQDRLRNANAALWALNLQDLERWRYRIIVVEQDSEPHLESVLAPLADLYVFAYNPGAYNRGWAFNVGACMAAATKALCLIDADLLPSPSFLSAALQRFQFGQRVLRPYTEIVYIDGPSTEEAIQRRMAEPMESFCADRYKGAVFADSNGGCLWVEPDLYHEVSGHDERFRGWGCEDRELWRRLGERARIESARGRIVHLDHARPDMSDSWAIANADLNCQVALGQIPIWSGPMGDLQRYSSESIATSKEAETGPRDWENWHRWEEQRIDSIVADELRAPTQASMRWRLAQTILSLGHTLLDVGCGPGAIWVHLEPHRERFSWAGIDRTQKMLEVARRRFPDVPLFHGDSSCLPFDSASFEVVLLRHVLEHQPQWLMERSLAEAMRVASRAALVDFYVPPSANGPSVTQRVGENFLQTRWTEGDIKGPVTLAGWQVYARFNILGGSGERDELWVLMPPENTVPLQSGTPGLEQEAGPKISIIMPTYRRCHTILRTLQTICAQTYANWELILVDNAGDGGYWFADTRIRIYCHSERVSSSYARNQGLQHAKGDLVCFFDDDDDMFPTYLENIAIAFQANPRAKMVRCGMLVPGNRIDFSHATPECCLRREYATPSWSNNLVQDQHYFSGIVAASGWSEKNGDIIVLREALCRANSDSCGGLRSGKL
jgi:glycosyltransferase involved in cell wall biosynthesis/SAM-dependent methyltransferase